MAEKLWRLLNGHFFSPCAGFFSLLVHSELSRLSTASSQVTLNLWRLNWYICCRCYFNYCYFLFFISVFYIIIFVFFRKCLLVCAYCWVSFKITDFAWLTGLTSLTRTTAAGYPARSLKRDSRKLGLWWLRYQQSQTKAFVPVIILFAILKAVSSLSCFSLSYLYLSAATTG